jgi:hypothetical protein
VLRQLTGRSRLIGLEATALRASSHKIELRSWPSYAIIASMGLPANVFSDKPDVPPQIGNEMGPPAHR